MKPENEPDIWSSDYSDKYEHLNYGNNLAGRVLSHSHKLIEKQFDESVTFERVLEVGAGSGVHLNFVRHMYEEYLITDQSLEMLKANVSTIEYPKKVKLEQADAANLQYDDDSFDRLIACHVLEHINSPQDVLREWARVVKPGGVLSLVLPCDPGLMWRLGRSFGPRKNSLKSGLDYDYIMATEHVNSITNLVTIIRHYFNNRSESWWPLYVPWSDVNLIYTVNIQT